MNLVALGLLLLPALLAVIALATPRRFSGAVLALSTLGMAAVAVGALWLCAQIVPGHLTWQGPHAVWMDLGSLAFGVGVFLDPMGAVMAAIVGLLATGVLIYTSWYLHDDPLLPTFAWRFNLFVAAMLGVVLSDNLLMTFLCWELVGLGSYLLIGFWWSRPAVAEDAEYQERKNPAGRGIDETRLSPAHAQLKAFVMNRVGDAGFIVGIALFLAAALSQADHAREPLMWANLTALVAGHGLPGGLFGLSPEALLTLAALGVFCGAVGKSAQFPLHTWLPDAMQGPTTASAIIHAATMVAAGVFLVARAYPLFPPEALTVVAWTGGLTCLLAASIACVQWDLKAVLAYSTVSQLGLMFVALGCGALPAGIAHLFTHAIFKCLLFLCAAAVIHGCHGVQDLHRLGGLAKKMPLTAAASLMGVLAIIGAPLMSGFYSKDAVLAGAIAHHAWGPLGLAALGSLLTSAYMLRWWLRIFTGESRDHHLTDHAHDPWPRAVAVLLVLIPGCLALPWTWNGWLDAALGVHHDAAHAAAHAQGTALALSLLAVGGGFAVVVFWWLPRRGVDAAGTLARVLRPLWVGAGELWGIDRLWNRVFVDGLGRGLGRLLARADLGDAERLAALEAGGPAAGRWGSLDGLLDGFGRVVGRLGNGVGAVHSGYLGWYLAATTAVGAVVVLVKELW